MNSEQDSPLLLTVAQVERLISYRRSKIYTLMREKDHPFPAQACRGRWRRADVERWVAGLGQGGAA